MASVVNAFRNILSDGWWLVKLAILGVPVFLIINNNILQNYDFSNKLIALILLGILYFGCVSFMMSRNINNLSPLLPGLFNIPEVIKKAVICSLFSIPLYALYIFAVNYIIQMFSNQVLVMYVIILCITLLLSPFVLVPSVLYSVRGSIVDALDIKKIIECSGNFSVAFLSFLIQYVFIVGLTGYIGYKLLNEMLKDNLALNVWYSIIIVVSIFILYSYCSDLYPETIPEIERKKVHKQKKHIKKKDF